MEKGVIYEGSSFKNLNEVDLCEISGGGIDPVLVAGACMIGVAGAGPLGCAGVAIFTWGFYNGYEGAKRG
ncbi:hypothetical protein SAMN05216347_103214 [Streptococcus equinus]|uniref:Class IIb bacteriocin, lactobin A/cerein 7B family n=1 Tax=Streptococcus equinus TaxID=1335 RepID=A0A1H0NSI0_STREI|nr:hypothetical protein [Streptococcus equinus]SDO95603.1 hypothetical protein SAMN05216347_103214 [Streptococcus equinus]